MTAPLQAVYVLRLSDMRKEPGNLVNVGFASRPDELVGMLSAYTCATYRDGPWTKQFLRDSPLEWFHSPPCCGARRLTEAGFILFAPGAGASSASVRTSCCARTCRAACGRADLVAEVREKLKTDVRLPIKVAPPCREPPRGA